MPNPIEEKTMRMAMITGISLAALLAAVSAAAYRGQMDASAADHQTTNAVVNSNGDLRVPLHYRTQYQFLGSWAIADDKGGAGSKAIHDVYASPGAIAAYRKDGHFPDGAVLVKEVFDTSTVPMTTGTVSHAETLKGWFVMVKESKNLHPDSGRWGDGWAWSWFNANDPSKTTTTNYKVQCLTCHVPAQKTDWIYVQGYPPLAAGR